MRIDQTGNHMPPLRVDHTTRRGQLILQADCGDAIALDRDAEPLDHGPVTRDDRAVANHQIGFHLPLLRALRRRAVSRRRGQ